MSALQLKTGGYRSPPQIQSPAPTPAPQGRAQRRMSKQLLDMELTPSANPHHDVLLICKTHSARKVQVRANGQVLRACSDVFDTILDEVDLSSALPSIDTLQPIEAMTAFITFITPHAHKHSFTVDELLEVARTANVFRCRPFVSASVKRYVEKAFVGPITNSNFFALLRLAHLTASSELWDKALKAGPKPGAFFAPTRHGGEVNPAWPSPEEAADAMAREPDVWRALVYLGNEHALTGSLVDVKVVYDNGRLCICRDNDRTALVKF